MDQDRRQPGKRNRSNEGSSSEAAPLPVITFQAQLAQGRKALQFDSEKCGTVIFEVAASEIAEVVKLLLYSDRSFFVEINAENKET